MDRHLDQPKQVFTGYWIPKELTEKLGLSFIEASLLSMIDSLDNGDERCRASNAYLAKMMGLSLSRISFYITKLKRLDLIEEISFTGRKRTLGVLKHNWFPRRNSKKESCVKTSSLPTRKHVVSSIYIDNKEDKLLLQEEASPQEVVFPCLDQLKLSASKKKQLSKKYSEKILIDAVKKALAWKGKRSHEAAIETILARMGDWNEEPDKEKIIEDNKKHLDCLKKNDGKKLGNYRCVISYQTIEFISEGMGAIPKIFNINQLDFIDQVNEFIKQNQKGK